MHGRGRNSWITTNSRHESKYNITPEGAKDIRITIRGHTTQHPSVIKQLKLSSTTRSKIWPKRPTHNKSTQPVLVLSQAATREPQTTRRCQRQRRSLHRYLETPLWKSSTKQGWVQGTLQGYRATSSMLRLERLSVELFRIKPVFLFLKENQGIV